MKDLPKLNDDDKITIIEEKEIERFNFSTLRRQFSQFFYLEKGFLQTAKLLILRPGNHIKAYLSIHRDRLVNPIKFYLVTASIYFFLLLFFSGDVTQIRNSIDSESELNNFETVIQYFYVLFFLCVFFVAVYSYLFFKKESGYNLIENLILNLYVASIIFVIAILAFPLNNKFQPYNDAIISLTYFTYFIYAYISFFGGNYTKTITKALLCILFGIVTLMLTLIITIGVVALIISLI